MAKRKSKQNGPATSKKNKTKANGAAKGKKRDVKGHAESLFDQLGSSYSDVYEHNATHVRCINNLISLLEPDSCILDVGCGTGRPTALLLTEASFRVTGIDVSSVMVEAARQNVPGAEFMQYDCLEYEPAQRFDAIVSTFALTQMPTSQIRKMAYRMAGWLKPGGYLVFGALDFSGVARESSHPVDHTGETFHHKFMNHTIRDNLFSVGDWVNILRETGIVLREANGTVYDMKHGDLAAEPECFLLGQKTSNDTLFGPHKHPYDHFEYFSSEPESWNWLRIRWIYKNNDIHPGLLSFYRTLSTSEEDPNREGDVNLTWVLDDASGWKILNESLEKAESSGKDVRVRIVQAAPYNDVIHIVNRVLSVLGRPQQHHGAILSKARDLLVKRGYEVNEPEPFDGHVNLFPANSPPDIERTGADIFAGMWFCKDPDRDFAERMLKFELRKYLRSQKQFGGRDRWIGFDSVLLTAERKA